MAREVERHEFFRHFLFLLESASRVVRFGLLVDEEFDLGKVEVLFHVVEDPSLHVFGTSEVRVLLVLEERVGRVELLEGLEWLLDLFVAEPEVEIDLASPLREAGPQTVFQDPDGGPVVLLRPAQDGVLPVFVEEDLVGLAQVLCLQQLKALGKLSGVEKTFGVEQWNYDASG